MSNHSLTRGGTTKGSGLTQAGLLNPQYNNTNNNSQGLLSSAFSYPGETMSVLAGGEMPSNQAYGDFSNISNNTGMPDFTSSLSLGNQSSNNDSLFGDMFSKDTLGSMQGLMNVAGTGFNIYNAIQGNKMRKEMLGFAREEAGRARDQWNITRNELGRIQQVRKNLNAGYVSGGNYAQLNAANDPENAKAVSTKLRT